MVFSSFEFILLFLPLTLAGYYLLARVRPAFALIFLAFASLVFYGWWNIACLWVILLSITVNFGFGRIIGVLKETRPRRATAIMVTGIVFNLALLGYFKYFNFFIDNINALAGMDLVFVRIVLPLGISFFTFQKIAYLVDVRRERIDAYNVLHYVLFVTFFPQLIAGPITHHKEMVPQFSWLGATRLNWNNMAAGLFMFAIGLFKKIVIADGFATFASWGFDSALALTMPEAWLTSLCYTFQIYFDFSGYTDMAIGAALMFNIVLPVNFNSPYKAVTIQDFWRRWHITLSRFLRDYLYIPLGGNRHGQARMLMAVMTTFILGGLWHGAMWTFVAWGALHGLALVIFHFWSRRGTPLPAWAGWALTFMFVNVTWVFFRAQDWASAIKVFHGMADWRSLSIPDRSAFDPPYMLTLCVIAAGALCVTQLNSNQMRENFRPNLGWGLITMALLLVSVFKIGAYSEFLYFQF